MPGESSSVAGWFTLLESARVPDGSRREDDPRLGEIVEVWQGDPAALRPGRAVLLGFPQDEGVRRNQGRAGAAAAPTEIRRWLYRLTPWDGESGLDLTDHPPLDAGNIRIDGDLEQSQKALGDVIAPLLEAGAVPVVLGGGHETAFGHYLGHAATRRPVGIINLDAHLDIRPYPGGKGHSGSPFRQALEHVDCPLPGAHYVCLGAQPGCVSRHHYQYLEHGSVVVWRAQANGRLLSTFAYQADRLVQRGCRIYLSLDADVVQSSEVPGVSAPNPHGLSAAEVLACVRLAGQSPQVASFDLVEINPSLDRDGQSARWAALVVWNFLIGIACRPGARC